MLLPQSVLECMQTPEFIWYLLFGIVNGAFFFELFVDWRQHQMISRPNRPVELKELCSEEEYLKSRGYSMDRSLIGLIEKFYSHIIGMVTLFGGVTPLVWYSSGVWMESWLGVKSNSEIIQTLLFQGIFLIIGTLESLPFGIYRTFSLEKRHGFNKTTVKTFVLDIVKQLALSTVFGALIISSMLWVIHRTGEKFVMATFVLILVIQLVMVVIYPVFIAPLFNKFTPLDKGELRDKIEALAKRVNFPLTQIFVIDGSVRSTHSNAYFFGLFKNKRIVLYDTLISQMTPDEATAIVGHELGHWAHNHMIQGMILNQFNILWMFYLFSLAIGHGPLYAAFGFTTRPIMIGLTLFFHLLTPLSLVLSFFMTWFSRCREFQADRYAINLGFGDSLSNALIKMYKENKSLIHPDWLYSMMHYSHPPPSERVAFMREYTATSKKVN